MIKLTMLDVQDITIIEHFIFANLSQNFFLFFNFNFFFFIIEFQNCGNEHDHGLLWIKNALMYGVHTNEEIEKFVNMYICCDVSLLPNLI